MDCTRFSNFELHQFLKYITINGYRRNNVDSLQRLTNGHLTSTLHSQPGTSNGHAKETTFGVTNGLPDLVDQWDDRYSNKNGNLRHRNVDNSSESPRFRSTSAPKYAKRLTNGASHNLSDENLVTIRIKPDALGRFGFNVKGGADLKYPIIVSRIVQGSQADQSLPRLNEGDQILSINNGDISHLTHDQVVRLIRSFRDHIDQDLILTVRPNGEKLVHTKLEFTVLWLL
uniref:PDZ domain-containing protein n=1 Tax=Romanomermis culicivorax TaxID=13658 RepID=A0A915JP85_ROMCU